MTEAQEKALLERWKGMHGNEDEGEVTLDEMREFINIALSVPVRPVFEWIGNLDGEYCFVHELPIGNICKTFGNKFAAEFSMLGHRRTEMFGDVIAAKKFIEDSFITWLSQIQRGAK